MEKNGLEVMEGLGVGRGGWDVCGYPRGDRKFLENFPMISGKVPTIYRKFPGSRGMSPAT